MTNAVEIKKKLLERIWEGKLEAIEPPRRWFIQTARTVFVLVRDIAEGQLTLRAMSLVYTTLLSMVPLLAVSFSVLKGFGVHNQLEPMLLNFLAPMGERGVEITEKVIGFVSNVKAGVLGSLGLVLLFYTVVSLMQKIERAFNYAWRVSDARSIAQRFSDYLSVIVIGPVLVFSAVGITASAQSNSVVEALRALPLAGELFDAIGRLIPYFLIVVAFTVIYVFVPNTRVKLKSALLGGAIAGVLWETTGWAFAAFVVNSAKYTAIYSAFASLILFMIWLYVGWLILLVGSSIAFYHQHPEHLRRTRAVLRLGNREREALALQISLLVGKAFHHGEPPVNRADLAQRIGTPEEAVDIVTNALCRKELLRETREPLGLVPTRSLEQIALSELMDAVRGHSIASEQTGMITDDAINRLADEVDHAIARTLAARTLRDLVEPTEPTILEEQRQATAVE